MGPDPTIMVHRRPGIDDHVGADLGIHVDHCAGDQQRTGSGGGDDQPAEAWKRGHRERGE